MSQPTPPPEPFIRPEWGVWGHNTATSITNPLALYFYGAAVIVVGIGLPVYVGSLPTANTGTTVFMAFMGLVMVALGVLSIYVGWRRKKWEIEYEQVMGYKPGKGPR